MGRIIAYLTGGVLVGLVIIPDVNWTVCKEVVIDWYTGNGRLYRVLAAEADGLGLAGGLIGNGQRARVEYGGLPLDNAAVGGNLGAAGVDFGAVNGQRAVIQPWLPSSKRTTTN